MTFLKMARRETAAQDVRGRISAVKELMRSPLMAQDEEAGRAFSMELERLHSEYAMLSDFDATITPEIEDLAAKVRYVYSMSIQPRAIAHHKPRKGFWGQLLGKWWRG